jgi:hypothetical protein
MGRGLTHPRREQKVRHGVCNEVRQLSADATDFSAARPSAIARLADLGLVRNSCGNSEHCQKISAGRRLPPVRTGECEQSIACADDSRNGQYGGHRK